MKNFSEKLIQHLTSYKQKTLRVAKHGLYKNREYKHILADSDLDLNYLPSIRKDVIESLVDVKRHVYFDHLNSSQAACLNLFVPLSLDKNLSNQVFVDLIPGFKELLSIKFEYSDLKDYLNERKGRIDNKRNIGTDSDIAIFYLNFENEKCLCLLEHKLIEKEFTNCNAIKSKNNHNKDKCYNFKQIWLNTDYCYYQSGKKYNYWNLTKYSITFFDTSLLSAHEGICPFKGSMQQLWRNMLMAQAIVNDPENPVQNAYFGVVYHQENEKLFKTKKTFVSDNAADEFKHILSEKEKFFLITIQQILEEIKKKTSIVPTWVEEYEEKYINLKLKY